VTLADGRADAARVGRTRHRARAAEAATIMQSGMSAKKKPCKNQGK
jgi:hypothetical protein